MIQKIGSRDWLKLVTKLEIPKLLKAGYSTHQPTAIQHRMDSFLRQEMEPSGSEVMGDSSLSRQIKKFLCQEADVDPLVSKSRIIHSGKFISAEVPRLRSSLSKEVKELGV